MPTYNFIDENTGVEFQEMLSMSDREAFLEDNPHIRQLPPTSMNMVAGVGGIKTDDGWKERQSQIAAAHPTSNFGERHGNKSIKETKTRAAIDKWRKKREADQRK